VKKGLKNAGIIFLIGIVVLILGKNFFIKVAVETGTRAVTGLKLDIGSLKVGMFDTKIDIKDIKLYNPKGFKDPVMVHFPEIYVDYSVLPLLKGKVHVSEIRFHMKEFLVVKNENGEVNLDTLKAIAENKSSSEEKPKESKKKSKQPDIQIDKMNLKVEKVVLKDYTGKKSEPDIKDFNINLDEEYLDIDNPNKLISIIVVKTLAKTSIAALVNIDLGGLQDLASGALGSTKNLATKALGKTTDTAGKALGATADTLKGTTGKLKGIFGKK
jgi:uncharacterized protein involved in outer membrane biogenesis